MGERPLKVALRCLAIALVACLTLAALALAATTAAKPTQVPLSGWLGNGTTFPARALVLSAPPGVALTTAQIHVTENGAPVSAVTLTPTSQAGADDFGVMLVVDQSPSMVGAPLSAAMGAVRTFAAQRAAQQQLGLITFDGTPSVLLRPTSDQTSINALLATTPGTGQGTNVPAAATLALSQLAKSRVALGAIVVISDGVGTLTSAHGPTPASVKFIAAGTHVPIFTVGLQDQASSAASLRALAAASPGQFVSSTGARLAGVLRAISSTLMRGYVVRYRSQQRTAGHVTVTAVADGVPGTVEAGYQAPSLAPVRSSAPRHSTATSHVRSGPDFSHASPLSSSPSFAHAGSPATPPARPSTEIQGASGPPTALVAGIVGVLIALAIMLALHRPSARAVRLRVGSFIPGAGPDGYVGLPTEPAGSGILRLLERGKWWVPFVENVEIARSPHTPVQLVKRAAAAGAVFAVLLTLLSGSPLLGLVPLLLWPIPLRMLIGRAARKQREVFIDSLPGYLQDLASALRVGRSFAGALAVVAESADEPVHSELERAVTDEALGRPLEKSLEAVAKRMCATDMDQVALIAELNRRSGSNVAEALDRVADGARDRGDLRRETKALTGQAKMSSTVLTALPPLLLILISVISPAYSHPLFHTTLGIALLILSALMVFAGWKVMKKITMIKA